MYEDILEDSWVYQEILHKGMNKGLEQGMSKGIQYEREAGMRRLRQTLYTILQNRFPDLMRVAPLLVERATEPEMLQDLIIKISLAQNAQEAQQALEAVNDQPTHS